MPRATPCALRHSDLHIDLKNSAPPPRGPQGTRYSFLIKSGPLTYRGAALYRDARRFKSLNHPGVTSATARAENRWSSTPRASRARDSPPSSYGVATTGEAEAIYALYVGAPAALRRRPLAFAAFARRFADGGVLRPGLRASARAFRRAPVQ